MSHLFLLNPTTDSMYCFQSSCKGTKLAKLSKQKPGGDGEQNRGQTHTHGHRHTQTHTDTHKHTDTHTALFCRPGGKTLACLSSSECSDAVALFFPSCEPHRPSLSCAPRCCPTAAPERCQDTGLSDERIKCKVPPKTNSLPLLFLVLVVANAPAPAPAPPTPPAPPAPPAPSSSSSHIHPPPTHTLPSTFDFSTASTLLSVFCTRSDTKFVTSS